MSNFETWWEREGQEFLFALNTTTDDDIKLVAEVAWKNGAYCAEQALQKLSDFHQTMEQEPVAKIALKNCIYFDSIDFNQTPPYLRYDTGDSTPKENWTVYCDIQEDLRKNGYELTDSDVDHDTVCGDVTPMAAPVRTKDLTDDEIADLIRSAPPMDSLVDIVRSVIAADREKNK